MITLISTPAYPDPVNPAIIYRWLATESPNNFRLLRHDFDVVTAADNGGYLRLTVAAGTFTGTVGDQISVFNQTLNAVYTGEVQAGSTTTTIDTDIAFLTGFDPTDPALDPDRDFTYINDNTLHGGYYFEGRLTINGVLNTLTIVASPDSYGYADLDVSGVLRTVTSIGKTGDYLSLVQKEPTKSGNFSLEYRECWYGSSELWTAEEGIGSPPAAQTWYYAECVRSEEQGSNLHEYVPSVTQDVPFLNSFTNPVYFRGLPFDLSFIFPELNLTSPASDITVNIDSYDSEGTLLNHYTATVATSALDGFVNSLTLDTTIIPAGTAFCQAEVVMP